MLRCRNVDKSVSKPHGQPKQQEQEQKLATLRMERTNSAKRMGTGKTAQTNSAIGRGTSRSFGRSGYGPRRLSGGLIAAITADASPRYPHDSHWHHRYPRSKFIRILFYLCRQRILRTRHNAMPSRGSRWHRPLTDFRHSVALMRAAPGVLCARCKPGGRRGAMGRTIVGATCYPYGKHKYVCLLGKSQTPPS